MEKGDVRWGPIHYFGFITMFIVHVSEFKISTMGNCAQEMTMYISLHLNLSLNLQEASEEHLWTVANISSLANISNVEVRFDCIYWTNIFGKYLGQISWQIFW